MDRTLGSIIRKLRKHRGMTLETVSSLTDISVSHLSLIERNRREASFANLSALADAFDLPVGILVMLGTDQSSLAESQAEISEQLLAVIRKLLSTDERYPASI